MAQSSTLPTAPVVLVVSDAAEHSDCGAASFAAFRDMIGAAAGRPPEWFQVRPAGRGVREQLRAAAGQAHALVLLTEVRNNSCSGEITLAIDELAGGPVRRKPVGLVAVGAGHGSHAVDHLRVVLAALDAVVIPTALVLPGPARTGWPRLRPAAFADAARAVPGEEPAPNRSLTGFVDELFWFTGRLRADPPNGNSRPGGAGPDAVAEQVDAAVAFIRENFADNELTLGLAARAAHMSKYHFSRTFKKRTGQRFIDFVTELRMERARTLLLESGLSVADICLGVGYRDLSHFQRTFKAAHAISPTAFRAAAAEKSALGRGRDRGTTEFRADAAALCGPGERSRL
ncbi:helix-turn-helix domain-containing protein [Streptodolium elevatio]